VGVLLELARQMSAKRPDVGVDILFVDGEDSGRSDGWGASEETWCIGTQYWIKNMPYTQSTLPRYGILLDMVGGIDATFPREYVSDYYARAVNDKVWSMASASGYGKVFSNDQRGGLLSIPCQCRFVPPASTSSSVAIPKLVHSRLCGTPSTMTWSTSERAR